jgi:hypothetical protein
VNARKYKTRKGIALTGDDITRAQIAASFIRQSERRQGVDSPFAFTISFRHGG